MKRILRYLKMKIQEILLADLIGNCYTIPSEGLMPIVIRFQIGELETTSTNKLILSVL